MFKEQHETYAEQTTIVAKCLFVSLNITIIVVHVLPVALYIEVVVSFYGEVSFFLFRLNQHITDVMMVAISDDSMTDWNCNCICDIIRIKTL